jgi:hypothetical protein
MDRRRQLCTLYNAYIESFFLLRGRKSDAWDFIDTSHAQNVNERLRLIRDASNVQISFETYYYSLQVRDVIYLSRETIPKDLTSHTCSGTGVKFRAPSTYHP